MTDDQIAVAANKLYSVYAQLGMIPEDDLEDVASKLAESTSDDGTELSRSLKNQIEDLKLKATIVGPSLDIGGPQIDAGYGKDSVDEIALLVVDAFNCQKPKRAEIRQFLFDTLTQRYEIIRRLDLLTAFSQQPNSAFLIAEAAELLSRGCDIEHLRSEWLLRAGEVRCGTPAGLSNPLTINSKQEPSSASTVSTPDFSLGDTSLLNGTAIFNHLVRQDPVKVTFNPATHAPSNVVIKYGKDYPLPIGRQFHVLSEWSFETEGAPKKLLTLPINAEVQTANEISVDLHVLRAEIERVMQLAPP